METTQQLTGQVLSGGSQVETPVPGMPVCVPVPDAHVSLYHAREAGSFNLGHADTDAEGRFTMSVSPPSESGIYYLAAARTGWAGMLFVAVIGPALTGPVTVNELTTVAAAYAMAQLTEGSFVRGRVPALRAAAGMCANLVSLAGELSAVIQNPPNGDQTNTRRSLNTLANLLAWSVREGGWIILEVLTTPPQEPVSQGPAPDDSFQAMINLARFPAHHATAIYQQAQAMVLYTPALAVPPDAWTLAVKVNDTGDHTAEQKRIFGGPANISWDANGYGWIGNNVFQGGPFSGDFVVVLKPDGTPSDGTGGTPRSPVVSEDVVGPGFGVAVDGDGDVWVGSFGWGPKDTFPTAGIVTKFPPSGDPLRAVSYLQGTERVQAIAVDADKNVWMASYGNDAVVVYPGGNADAAIAYPDESSPASAAANPFGVALDPNSPTTGWVTYGGGLGWPVAHHGYVARFQLDVQNRTLTQDFCIQVGKALKAVTVDQQGNAWVASGGDDTVYMVTPQQEVHAFNRRAGLSGPWGVALDGNEDVWVANFGIMGIAHDYTHAAVSKLAGAGSPSGLPPGEPLSPDSGFTLPTAGDPVTLPDGSNLYKDGTPCYSPLMRMTSVTIDQAGNLWAVNNWKPRFATDFEPYSGNPGGEGIVIFVGVAKPPANL